MSYFFSGAYQTKKKKWIREVTDSCWHATLNLQFVYRYLQMLRPNLGPKDYYTDERHFASCTLWDGTAAPTIQNFSTNKQLQRAQAPETACRRDDKWGSPPPLETSRPKPVNRSRWKLAIRRCRYSFLCFSISDLLLPTIFVKMQHQLQQMQLSQPVRQPTLCLTVFLVRNTLSNFKDRII